ncbi:hypothetical protein CDA63_18700 [Hymenobacter amundsenii]|uniref:Uncharacterized protein n=1 Tax=Hymenobacter amundsenii TaxID=2006685 RepID=A0A246FGD1_9BACT|nr:hypothetical protein [Hymenobacter amundsenii]OWP61574.1 hypothetical protein CDA63_18700 [Hymenobacter amundsenii]
MRFLSIIIVSLWCLAGCKKNDDFSARVNAAFNKPVTLRYQQGAALPNQSAPELTITVDDVDDTRCPTHLSCAVPGLVQTALSIRDQNGALQPVTLRLIGLSSEVDSAAVQANGRRYTIVFQDVTPYPGRKAVPKQDKRVVLLVKRR